MSPSRFYKIILLLLFVSGFSALVYEVTWMRSLSLAFGGSVYATSAVLTAYMGGLALGSWLLGRMIGRRTDAFASPAALLKLYALLGIGTGLFAAFTPRIFSWLTGFYVWAAQRFFSTAGGIEFGESDFLIYNVMRFGLSAIVLLIPTILMGGTFPVISQLLARREDRHGADLGGLYAVNTLGGVLGTFSAGLFLIRLMGASGTIYLAALLNGSVALAGLYLGRRAIAFPMVVAAPVTSVETRRRNKGRSSPRRRGTSSRITQTQPTALQKQLVLWGYALSGFVALGYEVVWTRLLAIFSLNAIFSFTIMLTTFLIGLTIGSRFAARRADRAAQPVQLFGTLQLGIGVSAVLVLFVFAKLPALQESFFQGVDFGTQVVVEFFSAGVTMIVPTMLMGAAFPLAVRVYTASAAAVGDRVGRLYALNTLGATLGALFAGFVLISLLGLQRSALTLALINLVLGVAVILSTRDIPRWPLIGAVVVVLAGVFLLPPGIYLGRDEGDPRYLVFYHEGVDATVSVFEEPTTHFKVSFVNGRSEVPTDADSLRAFHLLGNLPPLLRPQAQSALMVSFGNGIASGAMSVHGIARIESVELVAGQVEAARLYVRENRNVLAYPGLHITIEDGRNFLLRSRQSYDIITVDATHPINTSSWALFTREFYRLVRQRLNEDGVVIQWLPFHDLSERDYRDIVKTFQSVFPQTTLWYTGAIHTFLVGTPQPLAQEDILALDPLIESRGVSDDLGDARQLAGYFLMDEAAVRAYTQEATIVTDDRAFFLPSPEMDAILRSLVTFRK